MREVERPCVARTSDTRKRGDGIGLAVTEKKFFSSRKVKEKLM